MTSAIMSSAEWWEFAGIGANLLQIPSYKFGGVEGYEFLSVGKKKFIETVDIDLSLVIQK